MPQVGFEPTIPVFEREKTVHALDRAASVIGKKQDYIDINDIKPLFCINYLFEKCKKVLFESHEEYGYAEPIRTLT
jgi:hypothetical protein